MERDTTLFPRDDDGEVLWMLRMRGDALTRSRDIDFSLDFPSEQSALDCGMFLFKQELKIQLYSPEEDDPASRWTVQAMPHMAPSHADIVHMKNYFNDVATHFGGTCSDWGCQAMPGS